MIGRGAIFFAVWGYVISHFVPDREHGATVELNPKLIGLLLGESESSVVEAIESMCRPDAKSRTKAEQGKKLVKLSEYEYRVVNGAKYRAIRDHEARKAQNRTAQAKFRKKSVPAQNEVRYLKAQNDGASQDQLDAIAAEGT